MAHGGGGVANTLVTNGATLEDCHTNVFVLTELTGLKWCRYSAGHTDVEICTDVCEDPILRAYSSCLKQDLLCVWRRVPLHSSSSHLVLHPSSSAATSSKIDLRLAAEKELWVFWYGEEQPSALKTICASLTRSEETTWDKGVEYETRLLLFKALHNLIERSLLEREYVRLGRWFVQPLSADESLHPPRFLLAFNFSFFIHGENNVCVSVTVQRQPPVCRLSRAHLAKRETGITQKVFLAPFCIAATLSRQCQVNFDSDSQASKLWKEWSEFYPLPELDNTENMGYVDAVEKERQDQLRALAPPRMVEVVVSSVRLKYPTAYVLVECERTSSGGGGSAGAAGGEKPEQSNASKLADRLATAAESGPVFSGLFLQRATEELATGVSSAATVSGRRSSQTGSSTPTSELQQQQQEDAAGSWDFVESTQKEPCACGRSFGSSAAPQKAPSPLTPVLNKAQLKFGYTTSPATGVSSGGGSSSSHRHHKLMERQNRLGKSGPFHRRQLMMARSSAANTTTAGVGASSSSVPPTPSMEAQASESDTTPSGRLVTTPITPSTIPASVPSTSCPVLAPVTSTLADIPVAASAPPVSSSSTIKTTQQQQQSRTAAVCATTPSSSSSSTFVVLKPPPIHTTIFGFRGGKRKREASTKSSAGLWKRPRLAMTAGIDAGGAPPVNVGLGLSCSSDEANPAAPSYSYGISTQAWCIKKVQKHELANTRPFSTPDAPSVSSADYYPSTTIGCFAKYSPPQTTTGSYHHHQQQQQQAAPAETDIGSSVVGSGGAVPHPTSPLTSGTHSSTSLLANKTGNLSLPENIMEDSPTDISNEFLSPPPSHGHEDDSAAQHYSNVSRSNLANHNSNTTLISSTNFTSTAAAKKHIEYNMNTIYPTPPSIEAPTVYALGQFSPEATNVVVPSSAVQRSVSPVHHQIAINEHQSSIRTNDSSLKYNSNFGQYNNYNNFKSTFIASQLVDRLQAMSAVVENDRVAKYLLADTYAPRSLSTNRRLLPTPSTSTKMINSLPAWRRSENQRPSIAPTRPQGLIRPASPFFPYSSPGQQQHSAPGSPIAALPPPPPYGVQRAWPSPAAVGSPFSIRAGGPRTPASSGCIYDIQSPVSNASSSLCLRNDNSVDGATTIGHTPSSALSTGDGAPAPEGHGLVLSLLMCDTVADLYRDASFDSCPLCVCSMGIMGVDAGVYVVVSSAAVAASTARQTSNPLQNSLQNSLKCNCGFSAVRYRNLSWRAGLFYEDEYEATGVWPSTNETFFNQQQRASIEFVTLIRYKAGADSDLTIDNRLSASTLANFNNNSKTDTLSASYVRPIIELRDLTEMCNLAVEQACLMMDCTKPSRDDFQHHPAIGGGGTTMGGGGGIAGMINAVNRYFVADWGYMKATQQATNAETCFILRVLSPVLQESMQKSRGGGAWQTTKQQHGTTVEGPLSWRQLHRKCLHRTTNDLSGPEPIPLLLLATDRDWITVSPFALRSWDRLPLEPYGQQKDVVYIAVVPDNAVVLSKARSFFRSLSKTYEALRLGRHCPITRVLKDGIMPVSKKYAKQLSQATVDPSFDHLIEQCPRLGAKLKSYAQICRHYLSPHLGTENVFDKSIFRDIGKDGATSSSGGSSSDGSSSMPPPSSIPGKESQEQTASGNSAGGGLGGSSTDGDGNETTEMDNSPVPHTVVIYIVDAFTFGAADREDAQFCRVAAAGLHRCYLEVLRDLPDSVKTSVQMEIVPLQSIFETSFSDAVTGCSQADYLRRLAFSVFQQPRSVDFSCLSSSVAKPLTGFGTAASRLELIRRKTVQQKDGGGYGNYFRAHCPPVILAPTFEKTALTLNADNREDNCRVLFVSYCLSERQEWLLATATDHQGFMSEDCTIDLRVNNRRCVTRRPLPSSSIDHSPEGSMIWESLRKLWNFITALLSTATHPWRLVIGRLGRLGHEELKAWAHFLCRSKLRMTSRLIRERCGMCATLPAFHDTATILSACLISTEPDPSLRLFPNSFAHDDRFGQGGKHCPLSTPEDVSVTHVMVFPTSAAIHMSQSAIPGGISGGPDETDDGLDFFPDLDVGEFPELGDVFGGDGGFGDESGRSFHPQHPVSETGDESIQLQPLALGFSVSTAPSGWLPDWFWTNRPSGRNEIPVHLRSSLHIHTSGVQQSDDQLLQATSTSAAVGGGFAGGGSRGGAHSHPLDSSLTTDVLRYVLETYNNLSWLTFDTKTGDRRTCMPVHIQHLCRLYRAMDGFDSSTTSPS